LYRKETAMGTRHPTRYRQRESLMRTDSENTMLTMFKDGIVPYMSLV
jgi:hypothetical protein